MSVVVVRSDHCERAVVCCSWTQTYVSSLVPSVRHLSHGFQCSPTLNRQPYEGRLPLQDKLVEKIVKHDSWPIQPDILSPPLLRLTWQQLWLDLQPVDIKSRWRHNWKSAQVVNSQLVCDPTIRQPGFDLPQQQRSLLNRFRTEQGHCRRKWRLTDTDLCPCCETQTMSHIVESCPLSKLNGGLSRLHSADEDAVPWLTSYGLWQAYEDAVPWLTSYG